MKKPQKTFKVKRSTSGMGLGLFAAEPIAKGDFIMEYIGELITNAEADKRNTKYLFELDKKHVIDGAARENVARYINHFCKPNVEAEIVRGQIKFFALRNIKAGEELGYDYGEEYFDEFIAPKGCKCPACRLKQK